MELSFHGAAQGVTGSCHRIRANGREVLLDCGLFQGRRKETRAKNAEFGFDARNIDAVVQSHAHIDHSGKLPMLAREGFQGQIHSTDGTKELCSILLADCAYILLKDALYLNKKMVRDRVRASRRSRRQNLRDGHSEKGRHGSRSDSDHRSGPSPILPLYLREDVDETLKLFKTHDYGSWFEAAPGMRFRFHDAGHILGSAWIEAEIQEAERSHKLVFTGDYGRVGSPLLRKPEPLCPADIYISESTYGNRKHPSFAGMHNDLAAAVKRLTDRGSGKLLIPAFAVGRTQNVLYSLGRIFAEGLAPQVPVYVDSPLASAATSVARRFCHYFNPKALEAVACGSEEKIRLCPGVEFIKTPTESKALNDREDPIIIISASGMMEQGRILHHLIHGLPRKDCEVLVVGYQANGTLGRRLIEGAKRVRIFRGEFPVRARIETMMGFSAHADKEDLLAALLPHAHHAEVLFLVHGEDEQRKALAEELANGGFSRIEHPSLNEEFHF